MIFIKDQLQRRSQKNRYDEFNAGSELFDSNHASKFQLKIYHFGMDGFGPKPT